VGDCQRPADHAGRHGQPTQTEARTLARTLARSAPAVKSADPFDSDDWLAIAAEGI
jgi:hypothetical protein